MTNYPIALDAFNNPTADSKTNAPGLGHSDQHAKANDAIKALQTKLGINGSADVNSIDNKITRALSRQLTLNTLPNGDGITAAYTLTFVPIGYCFGLVNNQFVPVTITQPTPGTYVATFATTPAVGVSVQLIAMREV